MPQDFSSSDFATPCSHCSITTGGEHQKDCILNTKSDLDDPSVPMKHIQGIGLIKFPDLMFMDLYGLCDRVHNPSGCRHKGDPKPLPFMRLVMTSFDFKNISDSIHEWEKLLENEKDLLPPTS